MAAGKFFLYNTALKHILEGNILLDSDTIVAYPLHAGYTPSTASHSTLAQITAYQATASGTIVNALTLSGTKLTGSGAQQVVFDANDLAGFSADGDTFECKYVALVAQSASSGGQDNLLVGFFDTNDGGSAVEGTQLNVTWNSAGICNFNSNQ